MAVDEYCLTDDIWGMRADDGCSGAPLLFQFPARCVVVAPQWGAAGEGRGPRSAAHKPLFRDTDLRRVSVPYSRES